MFDSPNHASTQRAMAATSRQGRDRVDSVGSCGDTFVIRDLPDPPVEEDVTPDTDTEAPCSPCSPTPGSYMRNSAPRLRAARQVIAGQVRRPFNIQRRIRGATRVQATLPNRYPLAASVGNPPRSQQVKRRFVSMTTTVGSATVRPRKRARTAASGGEAPQWISFAAQPRIAVVIAVNRENRTLNVSIPAASHRRFVEALFACIRAPIPVAGQCLSVPAAALARIVLSCKLVGASITFVGAGAKALSTAAMRLAVVEQEVRVVLSQPKLWPVECTKVSRAGGAVCLDVRAYSALHEQLTGHSPDLVHHRDISVLLRQMPAVQMSISADNHLFCRMQNPLSSE